MSENLFEIYEDSHNRLCAKVADGITVGIKVFNRENPTHTDGPEVAYVVVDVETALGTLRNRDLRIRKDRYSDGFFVRWPQFRTSNIRGRRPEFLDVAGPISKETRESFSKAILGVFKQICLEAGDQDHDGPAAVS